MNITGQADYLDWATDQHEEDWSSYDEISRLEKALRNPPPKPEDITDERVRMKKEAEKLTQNPNREILVFLVRTHSPISNITAVEVSPTLQIRANNAYISSKSLKIEIIGRETLTQKIDFSLVGFIEPDSYKYILQFTVIMALTAVVGFLVFRLLNKKGVSGPDEESELEKE